MSDAATLEEFTAHQEKYSEPLDAIDYALNEADEPMTFLECWWDGRAAVDDEWSEWRNWVDERLLQRIHN